MTTTPSRDEMLARLAELRAANEAATSWGAAVGARSEEIRDPPLEDALGHLGSVLSILAELHPDDRSRALDNALAFYNARRPGAQVEPVAGVTRLVHQWPGPSDPSPTALPGWVENALDRSPATRREILRTGELASQFGWTDTSPTAPAPDVRELVAGAKIYTNEFLQEACENGDLILSKKSPFIIVSIETRDKILALLSALPAKGER